MNAEKPVIFFDGVCNFCNSSVQRVIKNDPDERFLFASLQGAAGQKMLDRFHLNKEVFDSFVLLQNEVIYTKSTAALKVARQMKGAWKLLYVFIVVPRFIRDALYNWIARNRYHWFGKKESCMIPGPEIRARFLL